MNQLRAIESPQEEDPQLRAAIIRRCALDETAIAAVFRLQAQHAVRFSEAVVRLGYGSASDLEQARAAAAARLPLARSGSVISADYSQLARDANHPRSEQIRSLRTELLLRHEDGNEANILAVLSPCPGEGRSQLAADLALSFAQLGRPTLLVDADLRHPSQHLLFNAGNVRGLAETLSRETAPALQSVAGMPMLSLLTAGTTPANPLELLSDRRFETLVMAWKQEFQFVVLDTPAVGRYADGLAVATILGRVLSLSRSGHTPYRETREMMRRLAATRSRVLGAVINHF